MQEQFVCFMDQIAPSFRLKIQNELFLSTLKMNEAISMILIAKKKLDQSYNLRLMKEQEKLG